MLRIRRSINGRQKEGREGVRKGGREEDVGGLLSLSVEGRDEG